MTTAPHTVAPRHRSRPFRRPAGALLPRRRLAGSLRSPRRSPGSPQPPPSAGRSPAAHSIAELVFHVDFWLDAARRRIDGEAVDAAAPETDWPSGIDGKSASAPAWKAALAHLEESHRRLHADRAGARRDALRPAGRRLGSDAARAAARPPAAQRLPHRTDRAARQGARTGVRERVMSTEAFPPRRRATGGSARAATSR